MEISVFGLGYVGCVSAACLAHDGHRVVGVDVSEGKVASINAGKSPIVEKGLGELIAAEAVSGRLRACTNAVEAIRDTEVSLVCVGTPSRDNGSLELRFIESVCEQIGAALAQKPAGETLHTVIIRSTMVPGTIEGVVIPALESAAGGKVGVDFHVCINPEFLREAQSLQDYYDPPFIVIGADSPAAAAVVQRLYSNIDAPVHIMSTREAEMVKYACNIFHAVKVSYANEMGNVAKALGIDGQAVLRVVCEDRKLNLSPYYMKPGFAFGGSCLPKDLRAFTYRARELDVEMPMIGAILPSNQRQIDMAAEMVLRHKKRRVGVLGLSFKAGTDDLRESPMVRLVERLIGRGLELAIYDRDVAMARLGGANKTYIEKEIPHIERLLRPTVAEVCAEAEILVIGTRTAGREEVEKYLRPGLPVIDLVRLFEKKTTGDGYEGICW